MRPGDPAFVSRVNALTSFFVALAGVPGPGHMARAVIYQQLNQQAAAMAYGHLPAAQLDGDGHGGVRLHSEQEQARTRKCCNGSHALATYLTLMTVTPGRKFHHAAKCVTA
jgi:hypothetical protein